jgi:hypothetical protein
VAESVERICNMALGRIGVRSLITSFDDDQTAQAEACRTYYEEARDGVLEDFAWPFAKATEDLALLADVTSDEWAYAYAYPEDCVAARYIPTGLRNPNAEDLVPYEIADNGTGDASVILTDEEDAALVYTRRITNPVRFSSAFTDALAFRLAAELALAIPGKTDLEQAMRQRYLLAIAHAKANARNEVQPDQPQDSETIRARL